MNDIIYLEPDDEITAVIDRLKLGSTKRAILVVPRGSTLAQSVVNLKILKRSAEEIDKEVVIVATDRTACNLASQIGLPVYNKLTEAERAQPVQPQRREETTAPMMRVKREEADSGIKINTYKRFDEEEPDQKIAVESPEEKKVEIKEVSRSLAKGSKQEEPETGFIKKELIGKIPEEAGEEAVGREVKQEKKEDKMVQTRFKPHSSRKPVLTLMTILLLFVMIFSIVFVPYASASLTLKVSDISRDYDVLVDKQAAALDAAKLIIPGKPYEEEKEIKKSYPATGKKDVGEKAKGKVTVYNNYDSYTHQYTKGTKFTANGKNFLADQSFNVSGATLVSGSVKPGEGSVNVTAEANGDSYNLEATSYVLAGAPAKITAQGEKMTGGVTREISVVTETDLETAEIELRKSASEEARQEIISRAKEESAILIDSGLKSEIAQTSYSKKIDEEADNFDAILKIKVFGVGFLESDLRSVIVDSINQEINDSKMLVNSEKAEVGYSVAKSDVDLGTVQIKASFKGKTGDKLSERELRDLIKNKSLSRARSALQEREGIENATLSIWPNFYNRTPLLTNRIKISFEYVSSN